MTTCPFKFRESFALCLLIALSIAACSDPTDNNLSSPGFQQAGITSCTQGDAGRYAPDGEGCAVLVSDQPVVAGSEHAFRIDVTVGEQGIAVGGGIAVGSHHAADWLLQSRSVSEPGFVTAQVHRVQGENRLTEDMSVRHLKTAPSTMFHDNASSGFSDAMFRRVSVATVEQTPLKAGDVVSFYIADTRAGLGAAVPRYSDQAHEFRVTTDVNGDGVYAAIEQSPVFAINPGPAVALSATLPAQVVSGVPQDIVIRVEDNNLNIVSDYNGLVTVTDEQGATLLTDMSFVDGMITTQVVLNTLGAHRLRLTSGELRGRSNPLKVVKQLPERRLYWGDLHGHTQVSDGLGAGADDYFAFGRDIAALDFVALTDHGHFDWPANIAAVQKHHEPGHYVTLLAQEAGVGPDHMNLYFRRDDANHIARWSADYQSFHDWTYSQYNTGEPEAMIAPHHFAYQRSFDQAGKYPFGVWDDRIARFVEVYSAHGTSEFPGNPRPLEPAHTDASRYMQGGLAAGRRFGVIAASDNHDSRPGRTAWGVYGGGLAGIWATELTRDALWESLWGYQTYGTSVDRIYVDFTANGQVMGSALTSTTGDVTLQIEVIGKTDEVTATVVRNNLDTQTVTTTDGVINTTINEKLPPGEHWYYLRVTQDNGERAWTSPVWVTVSDGTAQ